MFVDCLLTSDLHFTDDPRDTYRWDIFAWILAQHRKYGFSSVAILGDLTEKKDHHSALLVTQLVHCLYSLVNSGLEVYLLKGNHDYVWGQPAFFSFMHNAHNIKYFDVPTTIQWGDNTALFLPHAKHPLEEWKDIKPSTWWSSPFIFMHQTVTGAVASNGQKMIGELDSFFLSKENAQVYSGDIHVPQKIGVVEYVGSPYHVHFGDRFSPRVLLLDKGGGRTNLRFPTIERFVADIDTPDKILSLNCKPNDQIKIRLKIKQREIGDWPFLKKKCLEICNDMKLQIRGIEPIIERATKRVQLKELVDVKAIAKSSRTPESILRSYSEKNKLGEELLTSGLEIINK